MSTVFERTDVVRATWPQIGNTLRSMWHTCVAAHQGADVARALTVNFVGLAAAEEKEALRLATERLQTRTPCRAFLLLLGDEQATDQAEVAATTRRTKSLRDIVLEEVVLHLRHQDLGRMPGLVRPLLVNDLPNHLYWAAPWPADEAEFDALSAMCRHVVVDSRRFGNPARELDVLAARRQQGKHITDLNWLRLRPWRRALAEAFERVPWQPGTRVKGVVRHGAKAAASTLLLTDWLHDRVGAALSIEPNGTTDSFAPEHVKLLLPGHEVVIDEHDGQLVVHITTEATCLLPLKLQASRATDGDLLAAAIDVA